MVRESGISATKPIFPMYLLPSLKLPFSRRYSASSSSSASSPVSSATTTPASSPPNDTPFSKSGNNIALARVASDTLRCSTCSADLAFSAQIISKGFTGRYGRAFLVSPPPPPAPQTLLNIRVGKSENRQLVTGWHVVADITCGSCGSKLGWKYVDAKEQAQKYKVGKFILETERVVTYRSWENVREGTEIETGPKDTDDDSDEDIVFDSEDDEECEDLFAGIWDPESVGRRRSAMISRRSQS